MHDPTDPPRLACHGLTKRLPSGGRELTVLDDVTFEVPAGEFVCVLGPSGSGKSTLLGLLAGLDRPTSGSVRIDGRPIENLGEDALARLRREQIGFVFQSFQLFENFTALENVLFPLELAQAPRARERAGELLQQVGLGGRGHHYPSQLSGGEKQRVALARAFATEPSILVADEPTGNLDGATGRAVLDVLRALQESAGTTLVLATHDPALARHADRRLWLTDGRLVKEELGRAEAEQEA